MTRSKVPTFTLVRRSETGANRRAVNTSSKALGDRSKGLPEKWAYNERSFAYAFAPSVLPRDGVKVKPPPTSTTAGQADRIVRSATRAARVLRVGVLDLGAWFATLPNLLERLNAGQQQFTFFEVQAPLPAGLVKRGVWYADVKGFELTRNEKAELSTQIYANDFFKAGRDIRLHFELDYLVGIAATQVAGIHRGELYWNHFSTGKGPEFLISTAELRTFAAAAKRSFEVLVGYLLLAQLLAVSNPDVKFHDDRGCLFDYNESRVSIARAAAKPMIEPSCLALMKPENRETALEFMRVLERL